jgi:ribonuclease HI
MAESSSWKKITVHTDGGCDGNPGPGGWAALLRYGNHVRELAGGEPATTNNRMELQAAISALKSLKKKRILLARLAAVLLCFKQTRPLAGGGTSTSESECLKQHENQIHSKVGPEGLRHLFGNASWKCRALVRATVQSSHGPAIGPPPQRPDCLGPLGHSDRRTAGGMARCRGQQMVRER